MTKICANMIGRNEANKYLRPVLERLATQVDLITFTDDASDDDTADIAREYGAQVQVMPEPTFSTNEGKLRQASWEWLETQITPTDTWWILAIDCDEMLYPHPDRPLHHLTDEYDPTPIGALGIEFYHMWDENNFRVDKQWRPNMSSRLFKYYPGGSFLDRQLACGSEPTYVVDFVRQRRFFPYTDLRMKHLSYIKDEDKKAKYDRYTAIDGGAFHANAHIQSIMDPIEEVDLRPWVWGD